MRTFAWISVLTLAGLVDMMGSAAAGCEDNKVRIVFWAPSWFQDSAQGCTDAITEGLRLADDLYDFAESDIWIKVDDQADNSPSELVELAENYVGSSGQTKTLYLLGHGGYNEYTQVYSYAAMVFTSESARNIKFDYYREWYQWPVSQLTKGSFVSSDPPGTFYTINLTPDGIEQKLQPGLSSEPMVFAVYCHSNEHCGSFLPFGDGTYVGYTGSREHYIQTSCRDLEIATGTLLCAYWDSTAGEGVSNTLQSWEDFAEIDWESGWTISGDKSNKLVCGKGCSNIAARIEHVEAYDGTMFWTAKKVQSESYFIVRGYTTYEDNPVEVARLVGRGETPVGVMRTYSVSVPSGYRAFDIVEIDNAGRRTISPPADYGRESGFWDQWRPQEDYPESAYMIPPRGRRSIRTVTGVGVRSALSLIASNPEWIRRFDGGLEQTRRRARASKYPDTWRELGKGGGLGSATAPNESRSPTDEEFLADAILWAYDPWMIPDMAAHLEGFVTPQGYPLQVRWFFGDPDLQEVQEDVRLVLQANAAHQGERAYPTRPPLWFVGEAGWTTWDETICGTCAYAQSACYGYRRFYPGVGRKPVVIVPLDDVEIVQDLITGTEEWNAGYEVDPDGRVICFVGEHTGASSGFMRDMFSNFEEAFSTAGRPVDCYFSSDYGDSTFWGLARLAYNAVNAGAQYIFECALGQDPSFWSPFVNVHALVSNFSTSQRTFWVVPCCGSAGFQLDYLPRHGKDLLSNSLYKTTAVGVLGQMNGAFEQLHKSYLQYVLREMVTSSADSVAAPWWSIAEDAAQAMLADHGDEPDVRDYVDGMVLYAANPMLEPGTVLVSPYAEAEISSFVRKSGHPELYGADTTIAVGCPQGDQDEIVISVAVDQRDAVGPVPPSAIELSQPLGSNIVFYGPLTADSAATLSDGSWRTTITVDSISADSCGVDSAIVKLYNMDIGYARFDVMSEDVSASTPGAVNLPDLSVFAYHYPSSFCNCVPGFMPYWSCVDWDDQDGLVSLSDLSVFAGHYGHHCSSGGGGASSAVPIAHSSGSIKLRFSEDYPLVGPRTLRGYVRLEGIEPFKVMFLSFKNENPIFRYTGWQGNPNFKGRVACVDVVRNGQKEIVLMVVGPKTLEGREIELGIFELDVSSREPLRLTEDDFSVVTADVLLASGGPAIFGASQVDRSAEPVVFRNELAQNYPNPFNPATTIAFSIAKESDVELMIYDVAGARVRTLANDRRVPNNYRVIWDGKNEAGEPVASGVYFYRLTAGSFTTTNKMVLLR